jgi:hypothetical protein
MPDFETQPDGQRILAAGHVVDLVADQRTFEDREFALVVDPRRTD